MTAKAGYARMISLAGLAAILVAVWLALAAPAPAPELARPELRLTAWLCLAMSCAGALLLGMAAVLNSPPLLLTAGAAAAATLLLGTHSLAPSVLLALIGLVTSLSIIALHTFLWLSVAIPIFYAALVGVSAAYGALRWLSRAVGG
eukprot:COSAG05_NODE_70_length_22091_cov_108.202164_17_plen_146_part_00